ncbi:MAG: polyprenyl synthetase family protein [Bacteroidales bacterium]|jgi:octaprenyl-diphosphate synthase|nr:polyprenyl synthetase family protein [Bacteroidales bacterium]
MQQFVPLSIRKEYIEFEKIYQGALKNRQRYLHDLLSHLNKGKGKQIRPILTLLAAGMHGIIGHKTYLIASLVELLHVSSLIHDDVVDNAALRRNNRTINAVWNNKTAVLLGDYLLAKCMKIIQQTEDSTLSNHISDLVQTMTEGEIIQLSKINCYDMNEKEYYDIIEAKTALLFGFSLYLGAYSVGADETQSLQLKEAGIAIGMAFQIKDDLKDYSLQLKDKDFAKDIKEHIVTLPMIHVLEKMKVEDRNALIHLYKNHNNNKQTIIDIIKIVEKEGGIAYSHTVIQSKIEKAKQLINQQAPSIYTDNLLELLQEII